MATVDMPEDPRRAARPEAPDEAREESVRPVVALPRGGPSGLVFAFVAVAAGALLFSVLETRRRSAAEPSVRVRAADTAALPAAAPPLFIPPAPAPAPVTVVAQPAETATPLPIPPPPPPPPPPERVVYMPSPAPVVTPQPIPSAPRNTGGPALVIDNTAPATGAAAQNGNAPPGIADFGAVQAGGRVRAGVFANRATTVVQGTLIPAVLETAFDSTRPGLARAIVSRDVRGFDGSKILIPRGSRLTGEYRSDVASGQKRAFVNWSRLVRPDGVTIALGSPAADTLGRGGIKASVNSHFFERFAGALLQSTLDLGANLASRAASNNVIVTLPNTANATISPIFQQNRVVPTLRVPAGTSISIFVAHDLDFTNIERGK
ncbi:MAG: type secretion system protein VirB10 [Sphingomonadales bacterium]|jgi:type IV secretion system protein VirB10|nr:type secretion system protein VirB10 [Sphingomonadales bacterium]MEA3051045.1 type secretion system protein VirB10 [Sphingomonadales bacterium]